MIKTLDIVITPSRQTFWLRLWLWRHTSCSSYSPHAPTLPSIPLPTMFSSPSASCHSSALEQSWHSGGVPRQDPPKEGGKQEPEVAPPLGGPVYCPVQPPLTVPLYRQGADVGPALEGHKGNDRNSLLNTCWILIQRP